MPDRYLPRLTPAQRDTCAPDGDDEWAAAEILHHIDFLAWDETQGRQAIDQAAPTSKRLDSRLTPGRQLGQRKGTIFR
jgi:hypothetical protein